jgi:hypothetical protein
MCSILPCLLPEYSTFTCVPLYLIYNWSIVHVYVSRLSAATECEEKFLQQSNRLHTVLSKITNVSVKYDSKPNVYANSLGDVQLVIFVHEWSFLDVAFLLYYRLVL